MKASSAPESYQKNNLKTIILWKWLADNMTLYEITKKEQIIAFLDTKIKSTDKDPDKRWITTWNDYLGIQGSKHCILYFIVASSKFDQSRSLSKRYLCIKIDLMFTSR